MFLNFIIDFYRDILILPDEFVPNEKTSDLGNFSFDAKEKPTISKIEFVKNKILEFIEESQESLIKYKFEKKLQNIIDILQEQEKSKENNAVKAHEHKFSSGKNGTGGNMKDRINVFKDSLTHSLSGSWSNSLVQQLNSGKYDEQVNPGDEMPINYELQKHEGGFRETSSFSMDPKIIKENDLFQKPSNVNNDPNLRSQGVKNQIYLVKAKFNFKKEKAKDMQMRKNDVIEVVKMTQNGWWIGKNLNTGEQGYFPLNFVEVLE